MAKVNFTSIHQKVMKNAVKRNTPITRSFENLAFGAFKSKFDSNKRLLMKDLQNHPVTQELNDGPLAESRFINNIDGNLFSFIGFQAGTEPVEPIETLMETTLKPLQRPKSMVFFSDKINYRFEYRAPVVSDVYKVTEYPDNWNPGSWVRGLEKGIIPGLANYVFRRSKTFTSSRSGPAIQLQRFKGGSNGIGAIPYISEILDTFIERMKRNK